MFEIKEHENDLFYLVDLNDICQKHLNWKRKLPRVTPHYAVKCNGDPMLLKLLCRLGASFDCASKFEIDKMLALDISVDRIIFANPCKPSSFIRHARKVNVDYMTFDNSFELDKIKAHHPNAKLVLRIVTDDSDALCQFSAKFGADKATARKLIARAKELQLDLVGISFHVGSGQLSASVFRGAIRDARELFDYALKEQGYKMHVLDVGGGYPGSDESSDLFDRIAASINEALDEHFPSDYFEQLNGRPLRIIAEPGRYYCCSAFTLCTRIISKRVTESDSDSTKSIMYYINDGIFASFNNILYDHYHPLADLDPAYASEKLAKFKSSLWGPTCDGADLILKDIRYPEMNIDDWVLFRNMGAYTLSAAVPYNGMPLPRCVYVTPVKSASDNEDLVVDSLIKSFNSI